MSQYSANVTRCRCSVSLNMCIYMLCVLRLYDFVKLIQKSSVRQKQWRAHSQNAPEGSHENVSEIKNDRAKKKKIPLIMKSGWFCISSCSHFQLRNIHVCM